MSVKIVGADSKHGDTSFVTITQGNEDSIRLTAFVGGRSDQSSVGWEILDDPDDQVDSYVPFEEAIMHGTTVDFHAVSPDTPSLGQASSSSRWYRTHHPGDLIQKVLGYKVRAFVLKQSGDTVWSEPLRVRQKAVDVLRQEYVDFAQGYVPTRAVLVAPGGSALFSLGELAGNSDYLNADGSGSAWLAPTLTQGLDNLQTLSVIDFRILDINSGYRNPVHNWVHAHLLGHYATDRRSRHQMGAAVDVNSSNENEFYEISELGAVLGACMEPARQWLTANPGEVAGVAVERWDHVHLEWNPLFPCPKTMQDWSNSLLQ